MIRKICSMTLLALMLTGLLTTAPAVADIPPPPGEEYVRPQPPGPEPKPDPTPQPPQPIPDNSRKKGCGTLGFAEITAFFVVGLGVVQLRRLVRERRNQPETTSSGENAGE